MSKIFLLFVTVVFFYYGFYSLAIKYQVPEAALGFSLASLMYAQYIDAKKVDKDE